MSDCLIIAQSIIYIGKMPCYSDSLVNIDKLTCIIGIDIYLLLYG